MICIKMGETPRSMFLTERKHRIIIESNYRGPRYYSLTVTSNMAPRFFKKEVNEKKKQDRM